MVKKHLKQLGLVLIPLTIIGSFGLIYYLVSKSQEDELYGDQDDSDDENIYDQMNLFPKLSIDDFYQYLEVENGQPIITDKFVAKVVQKVASEVKIINGTLQYEIKKREIDYLEIAFLLLANNHSYSKTYHFSAYLTKSSYNKVMLNIKDLVYKKLKAITKTNFNDKSNIFEIGIDSLDLVELITDAEDELSITISDEALESIQTVGDVIKEFTNAHK